MKVQLLTEVMTAAAIRKRICQVIAIVMIYQHVIFSKHNFYSYESLPDYFEYTGLHPTLERGNTLRYSHLWFLVQNVQTHETYVEIKYYKSFDYNQ